MPPALRASLKAVPRAPGVYLFHGAEDQTLYVGKSVCLRQRIASYFQAGAVGKTRLMVQRAAAVEWRAVGSELEALILESHLIKRHQPPYNVLGREYPRYAFLRLNPGDGFPYLEVVTAVAPDGASYFGPFWTTRSAEQALEFVSRLFGLRRCDGSLPSGAVARRCLWGQLHRCQAPCLVEAAQATYAEAAERAARLLQGAVMPLVKELTCARADAAAVLNFERAAHLQRMIESLRALSRRRRHLTTAVRAVNFLIVLPDTDPAAMQLLAFSAGRLRAQLTCPRAVDDQVAAELGVFLATTFPASQRLALDLDQLDEMHVVAEWLSRGQMEPAYIPLPDGPYADDTLTYAVAAIAAAAAALPGEIEHSPSAAEGQERTVMAATAA